MRRNPEILPPVNNQDLRGIEDLLTPEEQTELNRDLEKMSKQRILAAGAAVLDIYY